MANVGYIEIHKNNNFFNKVELFKRFCSKDLEKFVEESKKYLENKKLTGCFKSQDIFGGINHNILAVIISNISLSIISKFNDIDIQNIVVLLKYIVNNEKINETIVTSNYKYQIEINYEDNNTYTIKAINNLENKCSTSIKTFTFYISQESGKLRLNDEYDFSIEALKLEINDYMLNLLYKYLHQLSSIDKLNIINYFLSNNDNIQIIENISKCIRIEICKQNIALCYIKNNKYEILYLYSLEDFECLKKEIVSILKSYTIFFNGTFGSSSNERYMVDKEHDINSYKLKLKKLILNKYFGYIYFKNINLLFYMKPKIFKELNILVGENIILHKCIKNSYINCELLFQDKDIQSGNDLKSVLDQYLGFNLLVDGPNFTGSIIPNQLKKINKILKDIKPGNKPIILSGYSQGSLLPLEIAKYNPDLNFIIILTVPTKGVSSYGILGKEKISYIPSNVRYLWVNYNGGIYPFFGHSIFKASSDLDIRVDYYDYLGHNDEPWDIDILNYGDILLKLKTELKRNYYINNKPKFPLKWAL